MVWCIYIDGQLDSRVNTFFHHAFNDFSHTFELPEPGIQRQRIADVGARLFCYGAADCDAPRGEIAFLSLKSDDGVPIVEFPVGVVQMQQ